jgi:hypothetical protein
MKKNLTGTALLILACVFMASSAFAVPTCQSLLGGGSVDVNPSGNTTSIDCTAGGLEFNNFQYVVAGGSGTPVVDLTSVTVTGGWVLLNFNPNVGFPGAITDVRFTFAINGTVFGSALDNAGLLSGIQENTCSGAGNTGLGNCTGTQIWSTGDTDNQSSSCVGTTTSAPAASNLFPGSTPGTNGVTCNYSLAGENGIAAWKNIAVAGGGSQGSFTEGFLGSAPEPMTFSLMGLGLLGLGLLRRRMKKK